MDNQSAASQWETWHFCEGFLLVVLSTGVVIRSMKHNFDLTSQAKLPLYVHGGHVDRLKYDQRHVLSVSLGVQKSFGEQNGILISPSTKFVAECVMPDFLQTRRSDAQYLYTAPGRR